MRTIAVLANPVSPHASSCLHLLFERQATRTPDAVAVEFEERRLTYQQLDERASQWAGRLRELGVSPDTLVGLCLERSLELVVAMLAILKTGGAYVPLDPHFPAHRLALILEDAAPLVLVTQRSLATRCATFAGPRLWMDEAVFTEPLFRPDAPAAVGPDHAAYVMYTSGSTGRPKGVVIEHGSVVNFLNSMRRRPGIAAGDVLLAVTTVSFDISVLEIFLPLVSGARVIIAPNHLRSDGAGLIHHLRHSGVTLLQATPETWKMLLRAGWTGTPGLKALTGGEALTPDLARKLLPCCAELWNLYGPTETTVWSLVARIERPDDISIGAPIDHTQVYVLDERNQPLPAGKEGELVIGGAGLARGYLKRPALTADRFVPDPFSPLPTARLYRTGDLGRLRPDGKFECLGRLDTQIKLRGFRIELGEIETALRETEGVRDAAVSLCDDEAGESQLTAFVVPSAAGAPTRSKLKAALARRLPGYMIPARFVKIETLPLTPNHKLDRVALKSLDCKGWPEDGATHRQTGTTSPDALEVKPAEVPNSRLHQLKKIWETVLMLAPVGLQDNFFDLGGHSLLAVSIAAQISRTLGVEIPYHLIFEHPTIARLDNQLDTQTGREQPRPPIAPADRRQPLPQSFAQQGMWLVHHIMSAPAAYNTPVAWHLTGFVDRSRWQRTLHTLMGRHEILRSRLGRHGDRLVQQIDPAGKLPVPWQETDLRTLPSGQTQTALKERLAAEVARPFDLEQAPLWRALWITLDAGEHVLAFIFHHSIMDDWSVGLFVRECERLHAADGHPDRAGLPPPALHYVDYAAWQRQHLTGGTLERLQTWWKTQLADLPPRLELPFTKAPPAVPSGQGAACSFQLSPSVVSQLRKLAREEETTLFTVLLTAFNIWLYRVTGQADLIVSTPVTQRDRPELHPLLGLFLNTLPIRTRLEGNEAFRHVLRQVRTTFFESLRMADLPFEHMVALAGQNRDAGHQPLHQVMFVLVEEPQPTLHLDQATSRPLAIPPTTSKNDLSFFIEATGEAWDCRIEYATDLLEAESAGLLVGQFTTLLDSLVENPEQAINRLDLLSASGRRQILVDWNQTARPYPRDHCIHELFEMQALRTPAAVAVAFGQTVLSYRDLDAKAGRIAGHLRGLGVAPGVLVAINVERSLEMVAGILGVLKAGGAYWALEEKLPPERLRQMLADARPKVLLTRTGTSHPWPEGGFTVASLDILLSAAPPALSGPPPVVRATDPAYVNYTSGSTGRPKGVLVPHRGVVRLVKGADYVSLTPEDTLLHLSPLSFDASTFELWGALLNGGRVALLPPGPPSLAEIGEAIRHHRVTTLWLTASLFHLMVDERLDDLKPLRQLLAGGDVLSPSHVRRARQALPDCRIINGYGPTENTTFTCCHNVEKDLAFTSGVPIGRPIANTRVYVLDEHLQPVPAGVVGELFAGGDGVACGYLNRPQLTAERFVPDPFGNQPEARLYRTGDRVRWRPDGNLEFLGRSDAQVKIRGFRVELGEIEAALSAAAGGREAVVVVQTDPAAGKQLVAYVTTGENNPFSATALKTALGTRLPCYMVPSRIEFLPVLPLTANGKVDRRALPAFTATAQTPLVDQPARTPLELKLGEIWERLFLRPDIGREADFFELGGHSLLAARLTAEIEKQLGQRLPISALFQYPTLAALAERLGLETTAPRWTSLVPLQTAGGKKPVFCIHGRTGEVYGFLDLARALAPDRPVYGLQAVGLDGRQPRHKTVEEMAVHYVREMRSVQPHGPYILLGHSLGGWLAYGVAEELHRQGETVSALALLDTGPNARLPFLPSIEIRTLFIVQLAVFHLRHVRVHLQRFLGPGRREPLGQTAKRLIRSFFNVNPSYGSIPPSAKNDSARLSDQADPIDYFHAAVSRYRPSNYPGPLTLFTVSTTPKHFICFWKHLLKRKLEITQLPGNHHNLIDREHAPAAAAVLERIFGRTDADQSFSSKATPAFRHLKSLPL